MDVSVRLPGVQKVLGEAFSKAHIRAAATPLPGVLQARVGRGQGRMLRDPVAQALTALQRVQLQAVQLPTEGLFIPAPGGVATTSLQFTQGAGVGHRVYYPGSCYGVGESTLSKTYGKGLGRDGSAVKSTDCSSKGPVLDSWHTKGSRLNSSSLGSDTLTRTYKKSKVPNTGKS